MSAALVVNDGKSNSIDVNSDGCRGWLSVNEGTVGNTNNLSTMQVISPHSWVSLKRLTTRWLERELSSPTSSSAEADGFRGSTKAEAAV